MGSVYISVSLYVTSQIAFIVKAVLFTNVICGSDNANEKVIASLEVRPRQFCLMNRHHNLVTCYIYILIH